MRHRPQPVVAPVPKTPAPRALVPMALVRAVVAAAVAGVLAGCGMVGPAASIPTPVAAGNATPLKGDTSPRRVANPDRSSSEQPSVTQSGVAAPSPSLTPLDRPARAYPAPKLPKAPAESADELDRIAYELKKAAWTAAGRVDGHTVARCTVSESELAEPGSYDFGCDIRFSGIVVPFDVQAKVTSSRVVWGFKAPQLPVTERKAVFEATRQSYKPARVTCDIVRLELVKVAKNDGLTCWVTDVGNKRTTYHGELVSDGMLAFRPVP